MVLHQSSNVDLQVARHLHLMLNQRGQALQQEEQVSYHSKVAMHQILVLWVDPRHLASWSAVDLLKI